MYMPWSGPKSNLISNFWQNISDFETALETGILKHERVLAFISTSGTEGELFELKHSNNGTERKVWKKYDNLTLTTDEWITSVLNDVKEFSPAAKYAMTVGCHGMGWIPVASSRARSEDAVKFHWEYDDVPMTRYFGGTSSEFQINVTAFAKGIANAGIKMEYILFDDCYMSTVEVAYDLKEVTDYLIACPTEVMAYGMPFHEIGEHLVGEVDYEGVVDAFYNFYIKGTMPYGTIAVTDCSEVEAMAKLMKEINGAYDFDPSLRSSLQSMDGYSPVIFFDLGDYVDKLCDDTELLKRFDEQLARTVPYKRHTPSYYSSINKGDYPITTYSGITISDPSISTLTVDKDKTAWSKASH